MQQHVTYSLSPLGYEQLPSLGTATALTIPAGCSVVMIQAEAQAVRWRDDGVAPTAAIGYPLAVGADLYYESDRLGAIRFIERAGGAILNVSYYGRKV